MYRYFFHCIALISFFFVTPISAGVNVVNVADGSTRLTGDVTGLVFKSMGVGSQTTYTFLYMDKKVWRRNQQGWGSPGFGQASMTSFVNSALAVGIPLSRSSDISNDVTARVQICLNDAGRLLIYCFEGAATSTPPVTPATCSVRKTGDIAFGTVVEKDVNGAKASTNVSLECDGDASVKVRFVDVFGKGVTSLRPDLKANLSVGTSAGETGFTYPVKKGVPVLSTLNVVLSPVGTASPGEFRGTMVVKVEVQ